MGLEARKKKRHSQRGMGGSKIENHTQKMLRLWPSLGYFLSTGPATTVKQLRKKIWWRLLHNLGHFAKFSFTICKKCICVKWAWYTVHTLCKLACNNSCYLSDKVDRNFRACNLLFWNLICNCFEQCIFLMEATAGRNVHIQKMLKLPLMVSWCSSSPCSKISFAW